MFIAPLEAIAINLLPMFFTNGYQFYKAENHRQLLRTYWPFTVMLLLFLALFSVFAAGGGRRRPFGSARGGRRPFGSARGGRRPFGVRYF